MISTCFYYLSLNREKIKCEADDRVNIIATEGRIRRVAPRAISILSSSGCYRELARESSRRNNSSQHSPRSRFDRINHFVGHRSDHVVAPFHRLGSARLGSGGFLLIECLDPSRSTNSQRPIYPLLLAACIGLKIITIYVRRHMARHAGHLAKSTYIDVVIRVSCQSVQ